MELVEAGIERVADLRDIRMPFLHMPLRLDEAIIDHGLDALVLSDAETDAVDILTRGDREKRIFPVMSTDLGIPFAQASIEAICLVDRIAGWANLNTAVRRWHLTLAALLSKSG